MSYDCLIIDDEQEIASGACEYFNLFDVSTHYVTTVNDALLFLKENTVHLILLDVNLCQNSGIALCKTLRGTLNTPILFVNARTGNKDMLIGLTIGDDDYITKPYSLSVLLTKVKVMLKRHNTHKKEGRLQIDVKASRIQLDGTVLKLSSLEYKLLKHLYDNKGRVVEKYELFRQVWESKYSSTSDGTLHVRIRRLRDKIEKADPNAQSLIKNVWGYGYVYDEENAR